MTQQKSYLLRVFLVAAGLLLGGPAMAVDEPTKLRFTLDWIPGSVHGPFFIAFYRGYYKDEGLDVTIVPGKGSAEVVRQLASGTYDMGYPDISVLIEFNARNPDQQFPELMIGYEQAPASIVVLKKSGITSPQQMAGKTLGAAANDSTFKLFPIFAKFAGFDAQTIPVKTIDPALREGLLVKGDVDAIAAQMFNAMLSLEAKGVKEDQVQYFLYRDYGLDLYSNGLAASRGFLRQHGDAVRGFIGATIKAVRDMAERPELAVEMAQRFEPLLKPDIERERLRLAMTCCIFTPNVIKNGFGGVDEQRLEHSIAQIAAAYALPRVPTTAEMFDSSYLPPAAARMIK
ncbi:MAG: ABC transporter substrate-binding protein [Alphaproteobacteria bacterium]|nr:ABC transporter substrate-binding protein [Alphaproteobacteria bacterium]